MHEIGFKIKELRKKKGLSQEELAEIATINLRTIQRIENNENEPHGKTLHLICTALNCNVEDLLDYGKQPDYNYLRVFHLSVLVFIAIPLGNIILPLILWITKKDKVLGLQEMGANLLNFQIVWSVFAYTSFMGFAVFKILHYAISPAMLYLFISLYALNIILPIVFAIKMKGRIRTNLYPKLITLIK